MSSKPEKAGGPFQTLKLSLSPSHAFNWKMIPSKWFSVALKMEGLCFHCWKHLYNLPPAAAISPQPQPLMRSAERQPLVPVRLERSLQRKSIHVVSQLHSRRNPTPPRPLRAHGCCRGLRRIAISHVHLKKKKTNKTHTYTHTQPSESMVRNYLQTDAHCRFDE